MSDRLIIAANGPLSATPRDHVLFTTDDGTVVIFRDPRRFGLMDLSPNLLDPMFNGRMLTAALTGRGGWRSK